MTVADFGLDIADRIQKPKGRLAETVAEMCLDNGVAECVIVTSDTQIKIGRDDIPAIKTVEARRAIETRSEEPEAPRPQSVQPDDMVSAVSLEEATVGDRARLHDEVEAELVRPRDDRLYTVVGYLRPPGTDGNTVSDRDWEFRTQSGKAYIARGVDPGRIGQTNNELTVIRAEIVGRDDGFTILDVKDVFEPEEP